MRHKCLAVLIVSILYIAISSFITLAEIKKLTQAETLIKVLAQSGIYQKLPQYVQAFLSTQKESDQEAKIIAQSIAQALDPELVQNEVEKNAGPFFAYLNGKQDLPNVSFDLRPFKQKLQNILPNVMLDELEQLPSCENGFEPPANEGLPSCLPQGVTPAQLLKADSTSDFINQIPDTYSISQIKNPDRVFGRAKLVFKIINYGYIASLALSILMIICLILLGLGWWPSILRWVGWGLFLPGFSMLLFTFISLAIPKILLGKYGNNLDPEIVKMIYPVVDAFNKASQSITFLYSGIIASIGLVLVLLSYILPHPPEPKPVSKTAKAEPTPGVG